jgi:predicted metal-dependent hydrolase
LYIIIAVVVISAYLQYESFSNEITLCKASDGHEYLVRNLPDRKEAANLLADTKHRCIKLVKFLVVKYPNNASVKRLKMKYRPDSISESTKSSKYTSYSVNKGEKIVFCLRSRDENEDLVDQNVLMFVALHELAHVMSKSIGHTKEFWDNFRFLLKESIKAGVYQKQDFRRNPVKYCGTDITDSPLYD